MNSNKGIFSQILVGLFMVTLVFITIPKQALAYTINATNSYPHRMAIAMLDYNDENQQWRCHGWTVVQPNSSRTIQVESSTKGKAVYLYASTSEASFSGAGYASSIGRTVNGNAFSYYEVNACPDGPNRRLEYFMKYDIVDGYVDFAP